MTFKKINKSRYPSKIILANYKAQSIFEYLILTTVVATVALLFSQTKYFERMKISCENAFGRAVTEIIK
ncbi:MAG: hypothetical protein V1670_03215 [Candidatus Omnitrophota bacterium]